MKEQQRKLNEKLRGHDGYYGVTGNTRMRSRLRYEVAQVVAAAQSQQQPELGTVPGHAECFSRIFCSYHSLQNAMNEI